MVRITILGAGPIGAAVAHRLAQRGRCPAIQIVDAQGAIAAGKALDIRQSGPVEHSDTTIEASDDVRSAAGAGVVVVADEVQGGEWQGDRGLALVRRLLDAGTSAPLVFAGPAQASLMETAYRELKVPAARLIGSAPGATVSGVRAMAAIELGLSSVELAVVGRPPAFVIGWAAASSEGSLLNDRVPAHRLLAIEQTASRFWPPRPYAIASATAPIVEALIDGSRRRHQALTIVDGDLGARGAAVLLPLELGRQRVLSYVVPSLSPQERTALLNAIGG